MASFTWRRYLHVNTDPNWQVKTFTDTFLNIMLNFIPNETKIFLPRNPPWITKPLTFQSIIKLRIKLCLDAFPIECQQAVESAKLSYLANLGNKVNNPSMSPKSYWKIINIVMNKEHLKYQLFL